MIILPGLRQNFKLLPLGTMWSFIKIFEKDAEEKNDFCVKRI
jgi:hypothetical protein